MKRHLEQASEIISCMLSKNAGEGNRERNRVKVVDEEEKKYGMFTRLAEKVSELAVKRRAEEILQRIKREGIGKEP